MVVNPKTIQRRFPEYGLRITYNYVSNEELDSNMTVVLNYFPNIGYRSVYSHLMVKRHKACLFDCKKSRRTWDQAELCIEVSQ